MSFSSSFRGLNAGLAVFALGTGLAMSSVAAQQAPAGTQPRPAQKQTAPVTPKAPATDAGETAARGSDSALRQRVEQLEEQLVDMQVMVGTLESLAKGGGGNVSSAPAARGGGADQARVDGLETQVRQLSQQVEQLSSQVRSMGGRPVAAVAAPRDEVEPAPTRPQRQPPIAPSAAPSSVGIGGFGSTTVTPDTGAADPIGRALQGDGNPKQLYETAYGYLLQQDYASAEASFDEFLKRHPSDALAGNAQYWLGESHFVRGQYKAAAGAFLKGYQTYARSAKAPDSLLKLAMSLDRLGQKDAACSSFGELNAKFPQAPAYVKTRADNERRRLGCV
jgi:tol-pal system protein YbgF